MPYVFISHSSRDDEFVSALAGDLRSAGVEVWVDHHDIPPGANWDREVERALKSCETMIVVLSAQAIESENVTDEWSYYLEGKKTVVPVLIEDCEIPFRLRRRQRIDFSGSVDEAFADLCTVLGVEPITQPIDAALERLPDEPETVPVPAGSFRMGSTPEQVNTLKQSMPLDEHIYLDAELPQHIVNLAAYRIGTYPVMVGEYQAFIQAGGYHENRFWTLVGRIWRDKTKIAHPYLWTNSRWTGNDRLPVIGVSWFEAVAYCTWLAEVTGRHYRLPSEAEWEYAARGTQGLLFPWGNSFIENHVVYELNSGAHTVEVGSKPGGVSWCGVFDMSGNVWEWVNSIYQPYPYYPDEREHLKGNYLRVLRGGSWQSVGLRSGGTKLRTMVREWGEPSMQDFKLGFRVAMTV